MSITKLAPVGGWATVQYSAPTLVGSYVRAQGTPLPTKAPRILIGLLTGGDDLPPTYVAQQNRNNRNNDVKPQEVRIARRG